MSKVDMDKYLPKVGDSIVARRKVNSNIYENTVVGPVVETWENACRIHNNPGTIIEYEFKLYYKDWDFMFLHKTDEENQTQQLYPSNKEANQ